MSFQFLIQARTSRSRAAAGWAVGRTDPAEPAQENSEGRLVVKPGLVGPLAATLVATTSAQRGLGPTPRRLPCLARHHAPPRHCAHPPTLQCWRVSRTATEETSVVACGKASGESAVALWDQSWCDTAATGAAWSGRCDPLCDCRCWWLPAYDGNLNPSDQKVRVEFLQAHFGRRRCEAGISRISRPVVL